MFSAGMGCYMRYLQHLSDELNMEKPDVVQLIERHNLEHADKRGSGGALWVIGGRELLPIMLKLRNSGFFLLSRLAVSGAAITEMLGGINLQKR